MSLRIILVGEETAGIQTLKGLNRLDHHVVAVMASPSRVADGGATLWDVAGKMGYDVIPSARIKDPSFADHVLSERVDIILNVHSKFIMNPRVLAAPGIGSFNLHPGPLPRYAGLNPASWALYNGETTHAVTLHKMVPAIDAGPIVYQSTFEIKPNDSAILVLAKCAKLGEPLVMQLLKQAATNPDEIPLLAQDLDRREYFDRRAPDLTVRWDRPAREIVNLIRACDFSPFASPWGNPRTRLVDNEILILKAGLTGVRSSGALPGSVARPAATEIHVATGDEWIAVKKISVAGKTLAPIDVLSAGDRFEDAGD